MNPADKMPSTIRTAASVSRHQLEYEDANNREDLPGPKTKPAHMPNLNVLHEVNAPRTGENLRRPLRNVAAPQESDGFAPSR